MARCASWLLAFGILALAGCERPGSGNPAGSPLRFDVLGEVRDPALDEISGIAALPGGNLVVHNDDGPARIFVIAPDGERRATISIGNDDQAVRNRDWEDLAVVPGPAGPLLAIGDIGDNLGVRGSVRIYFVPLPAPDGSGRWPERLPVLHTLRLNYADGPRDAESLGYDPAARQLLVISKRDMPPRIYRIALEQALQRPEAQLDHVGELTTLRPPTPEDLLRDPLRGAWISQPTAFDIAPDGRTAAVLTYRSLYLYLREPGEDWLETFGRAPIEVVGPPGTHDEAVTFEAPSGGSAGTSVPGVVVTTEKLPAPLYRLPLEEVIRDAGRGGPQPASMP